MAEPAAPPLTSNPQAQESVLRSIETLLSTIFQAGGFNLSATVSKASAGDDHAPEWIVDLSGPDADLLLESRAELLDAFAYIALKAARVEGELFTRILFDCKGYRRARAEELKLMAHLAAGQAAESGEPFALSPMNAAERRAVHLALKDDPRVRTESQGFGVARHVVILPAATSPARRYL